MAVVEWIRANPTEALIVLGAIVQLCRIIVKYTPTPADDTLLAKALELAKFFGIVIPTAKVDAATAPAAPPPAYVPVIRDLATGERLPPDVIQKGQLVSVGDDGRVVPFARRQSRRPILRAALKAIAEKQGVVASDEALDDAIGEVEASASGPILTWLLAHPEIVMQILRAILSLRAQSAAEVSA